LIVTGIHYTCFLGKKTESFNGFDGKPQCRSCKEKEELISPTIIHILLI